MGGNARAVDMKTGDVVTVFGRDAYAEQVNLKKVDINQFKGDIENALFVIDRYLLLRTGSSMWGENIRKELFLGSAALVWDKEFFPELLNVKQTLGDIDVAVPEERLQDLWEVLAHLQGKQLSSTVTYVGQNRLRLRKPQINAVFMWGGTFVQVDFVGLPFDGKEPSKFVTFARSSPREDILKGVKGVAHKYLLMTLAWATSHHDDIVILTDKSPLPPEKPRLKTMHEPARVMSFSIDRGYRCRVKVCTDANGNAFKVDGKVACKEIPTSESSYVTDVPTIFRNIFQAEPKDSDLTDFGSFQGLIRLSNKYLSPKVMTLALDQMLRYKLYGPGQAMSRDSADADRKIKERILDVAKMWCPSFESYDSETKALQTKYYSHYNEREVDE